MYCRRPRKLLRPKRNKTMKFAQITITIELDEDKLTYEQRCKANADDSFSFEHPVTQGVEDLRDAISAMSPLSYFNYLKDGRDAITVRSE